VFTLSWDNLADRWALGLAQHGVRPAPGQRLRGYARASDYPMLLDSMTHIPAWAREAARGAAGTLPFILVTIIQRERSRSWSVELFHQDGYRLSARVEPAQQTPEGVARAVERGLARVTWSRGPRSRRLRAGGTALR